MDDRIPVTTEGLAKLRAEYDELVNVRRPGIIRAVAQAREEGDLRENAGYHAAKHDQGFIEGRIRELEAMFRKLDVIESSDNAAVAGSSVSLGSTVTVEVDGETETYTIVGAVEANPRAGRISNLSPYGKALLGAKVGDVVTIEAPGRPLQARVVSVE